MLNYCSCFSQLKIDTYQMKIGLSAVAPSSIVKIASGGLQEDFSD